MDATTAAQLARDRRLRSRLLRMLHDTRGNDHGGWHTARYFADLLRLMPGGPGEKPAAGRVGDQLVIDLLRDLVAKGFTEERDDRDYEDQDYGADVLSFRVTAAGSSYVNQTLPPDADLPDGRIVK